MDSDKKSVPNVKRKKKMTKAQLQLAIIKKKELDAQAQIIVERLLEPNIDAQWLLANLYHINKCHMEDVIEERSIEKLCGYILCEKPLTKMISQRFHISTSRNKVYDVSRRKKFCSSYCYGAANYLLEQMLTSPLWLREDEKIPEFRLLPETELNNVPGEEVIYQSDTPKEEVTCEERCSSPEEVMYENSNDLKHHDLENIEESINKKDCEVTNLKKPKKKSVTFQLPGEENRNLVSNGNFKETPIVIEDFIKKNVLEKNHLEFSNETSRQTQKPVSRFQKERKLSKKSCDNFETIVSLIERIEGIFKQWITEDTLRLLFGKETVKQQVLDNIQKQEQYAKICQKLNELQIEEEEEEKEENEEKMVFKAVPDYGALQEEGRQLELKVRAFYGGRSIMDCDLESCDKDQTEKDEDSNVVTILTDSQAPNAIRRRIFIDKINSTLQDVLQGLSKNGLYLPVRFTYGQEITRVVKVIVSTFSLTAENIILKSSELTLVCLIIIKMLSAIEPELKNLLKSKEGLLYTSMILMSYQLNADYLDTFMVDLNS